ncbi:MAG: extracellular solute-binding protein [Deltaproteobacteria bacterium]|nr:MAG: extracellular solute-binding protein [Deltaproteobacteria bacterium]
MYHAGPTVPLRRAAAPGRAGRRPPPPRRRAGPRGPPSAPAAPPCRAARVARALYGPRVMRWTVLAVGLACAAGCPADRAAPAPRERVRLWHTFSAYETEALNRALADRGAAVESTLLPFSRARQIVADALRDGHDCPDLVRIDATWLPELAGAGLLAPVPDDAPARAWLPEAAALARHAGTAYGVPQALDGLALLYDPDRLARAGAAWPPRTVNELVATAHQLTIDGRYGLSVRVDGYWFVAFLRAWGGDVVDPATGALGIDRPEAVAALDQFAALFGPGGVAPPPPPPGREAPATARWFREGRVAIVVDGPWAVPELRAGGHALAVAPFPPGADGRGAAPLGGALFCVPACARRADAAWRLAFALTEPAVQAAWARDLGVVPTTEEALAGAGAFARAFRDALRAARPLPRHPITAELFDDLTPAVAAVVAGDATAEEALAGVARAWTRLLARHRGGRP